MYLKLALIALALLFLNIQGAAAQVCSFSNTGVDFGNVNLTAGSFYNATGTLTASCSGTAGQTVRICANFNAGSGGVDASGDPRYLVQGATQLSYNLFRTNGVGRSGPYTGVGAAPARHRHSAPTAPAYSTTISAASTTTSRHSDRNLLSLFSGTNTQIDYAIRRASPGDASSRCRTCPSPCAPPTTAPAP
jgi:hypothetical protein